MTPADQIYSLPTNTGAAKLAYGLANNLPVQISHMAIGDGNGALVNPTAAATGLVREVHRAQLNQLYQHPENPKWMVAELVIPAEVGGWTIRELGLYDAAGDLIFVGNHAEQYKPVQSQGSDETKTIRMVVLVSDVAAVTLKTDPTTVMATIKFVNDTMAAHTAAADPHAQYAPRGKVTALSANTNLAKVTHEGLLLLDAAAGARTFTLPAASAALGVVEFVLRRTDATSNALVIAASGADKIMLDTTAEAAGQASTELLFAGDFLRLRSDGAGKWWCVGQAQLPGSIASGLVAFTAPGSHTFTVPAVLRSGRRVATVTVTGGGASGGHYSDGSVRGTGAGGSAGGTAIRRISLTAVESVTVVVGAGGAGVLNAIGSPGGTSSFGAYCSATGGQTSGATLGFAGLAGVGIGGDINLAGQGGAPASPTTSTTSNMTMTGHSGGNGGASYWGGGTRGGFGINAGDQTPGAGGGGNVNTVGTPSLPGGAGIVEIRW